MKFWKNMAICSAALLLLGGCGGKLGTKTVRMNVGAPEGTVWGVAADTFAQRVEENTGGRWRVETVYGDTAQGLERLLDGKAEAELCAVSDLTALEERLSVLSLPWLFADAQDVDRRLFHGPGGETVRNLIRNTTLEPLALGENGFRQVTNDRRPVSAPADFRGLTIRVGDEIESTLFAGFGAEPVRMDWPDTFPALRDGDVSGQQNTLEAIRLAQVDRVQRYLTLWNCAYDPLCLCVSAELWAKLSDEDKEVFYDAARAATAAEITASRAQDAETLRSIQTTGVQVTTLSATQIQAFRTVSEGIYDAWRDAYGDELLAALGYSG
ncbi:MAG: TRAP transporter substrate-binding protein DctP [Oscillibacter sp.]|nr:TRAP transporter substrate-binding protein DctP [Oscillibacter sp.]